MAIEQVQRDGSQLPKTRQASSTRQHVHNVQQQNTKQQQQQNAEQQQETVQQQQQQIVGQQQQTVQQQQQQNVHQQQQQQIVGQQQQPNQEQQHDAEASTSDQSREQRLTYREKRRLEQAEHRLKFPDRKRRGPTRGKKYVTKMWNPNSEEKIKINFMDELRRVVGEKADEFICDCSNWVKEFCPLKSLNWAKMDSGAKERLYKKIRAKYDLPDKVAGADVTDALSFQCSMLYKHWRFRLKEKYFRNKSIADAINSIPDNIDANQWTWLVCEYWNDEKQKRISKVNTDNKLKQTETPANGARHKDKGFEPNAEKDYEALRNLHEKEVKEHGEDTLSVKAAYMEVFKPKSGYVKGLGPGARPPKKRRVEGETNESLEPQMKSL
ncbi:TPR-containing protein DDB_G0280363-like [Chenopodium quinoa]|uniref:TPR-containing protein DDB_G0280363-like n=1 Tax=Chenopodium quinoa TaxID=63459 RepID=UPI000B76DB59|nr:TPR-containing protein DDB_G0280363-like [Chenopodium quinoa]